MPSRRLGVSLGVDLLVPKTCSLNCVYCECGPTTRLTCKRGEYVPTARVADELEHFLSEGPAPDFVTFAGSGEPTLHAGLGELAAYVKKKHPDVRTALLTNATLFSDAQVRADACLVDVVVASVDAGTHAAFAAVNRPHPGLSVDKHIAGLTAFAQEYRGELWVEVFLVPGRNDSPEELEQIAKALCAIAPSRVQVNHLDRPGAEPWVAAEDAETLKAAARILGAEIIGPPRGIVSRACPEDQVAHRILAAARRRPLTADDMGRLLGLSVDRVLPHLDQLLRTSSLREKKLSRGVFYLAAD
ncbi:MAG: radical SAM protein [Thermodesulfobacteriota bacterium]